MIFEEIPVNWLIFLCDRSSKHYEQDSKVQFVIDAVYAFAHALQNMKNVSWNKNSIIIKKNIETVNLV